MPRPLNKLAAVILTDWGPYMPPKGFRLFAMPYVQAMLSLEKLSDYYGVDDAEDIVLRFLSNAAPWRGEVARQVKSELNQHLKEKQCL